MYFEAGVCEKGCVRKVTLSNRLLYCPACYADGRIAVCGNP
jgi:hypothetical protein